MLRQDLVLADKELAGVLQLDSSCDICGQPGAMKNIYSETAKIERSVFVPLRELLSHLMKTPCSPADLT